jgi:dephospho-CoA kinase
MKEMAGLYPYAIREAAILFESHSAAHLDFVIGVSAPLEMRIQRTLDRDHTTRDAVLQRMNNQMDEETKMRLCDAVIHNDEEHPLIPQVLAIHAILISRAHP